MDGLGCAHPGEHFLVLSGGFAEDATKSLDHDPFGDPDHEEGYDYLSDSDLEDDVGVAEPATKGVTKNHLQHSNVGEGSHDELGRHGKVVVIRGISYLTSVRMLFPSVLALLTDLGRFQAIVMYLYTDEIDFAPFGSKANRELRKPELLSTAEDTIPRPSPKSIYRVADMVRATSMRMIAN